MKVTLEIEDNRINDFLELISPLSYISKKEGDWFDELTETQKKSIYQGLNDIEQGNVVADDEVRYAIREKIEKAKGK